MVRTSRVIAGVRMVKADSTVLTPSATAILTYPSPDYDGDYVRPDGGDWRTKFSRNPQVNWDHGCPIGVGRVEMKLIPVGKDRMAVPVGTTRFFTKSADLKEVSLTQYDSSNRPIGQYDPNDCLRMAEDAYTAIRDGFATGVSIEFEPVGHEGFSFWKTGSTSPVNHRPSFHFDRWMGLGWAHTPHPINPSAQVLTDSPFFEKAFKLASDGCFPGGKQVHPTILKSFQSWCRPRPTKTVPSGWRGEHGDGTGDKSMSRLNKALPEDDEELDDEMALDGDDAEADDMDADLGDDDSLDNQIAVEDDVLAEDTEPEMDMDADPAMTDDVPQMKPTPKAMAEVGQGLQDLSARIEEMLASGTMEHERGIERLSQLATQLKQDAADFLAEAAEMFPDAGLGAPDDVDASEELPVTDDGAIVTKSFPTGLPVRRFSLRDLQPVDANDANFNKHDERALRKAMRELTRLEARFNRLSGK